VEKRFIRKGPFLIDVRRRKPTPQSRSSLEQAIERVTGDVSKQRLITIQNGQENQFFFELPSFPGKAGVA